MIINQNTDVRIIALTSAALRLENIVNEKHIEDASLITQAKALAESLRSQIRILQLQSPSPESLNA